MDTFMLKQQRLVVQGDRRGKQASRGSARLGGGDGGDDLVARQPLAAGVVEGGLHLEVTLYVREDKEEDETPHDHGRVRHEKEEEHTSVSQLRLGLWSLMATPGGGMV